MPGILGHFWRIEQTLLALCSARFGVELLPSEYRISLTCGAENCVAKHYVGAVRHLMYSEGMRRLYRNGLPAVVRAIHEKNCSESLRTVAGIENRQ
jgi:hypothetical protein